MTSEADGERPYRFQAPWVDFTTALHCAYGTVLALMARQKTGLGQIVEGALLGAALTVGNGLLIEQDVLGINRTPTANRSQTAGPVDIFKTRDGWILVQVIGDPLYHRWARLMGEDQWLTDPRFKDDISRGDNGAVISECMSRWCAERTSDTALETLGKAMIPAGPVLKPQQTLDDPHVRALNFFQSVDYPGLPKPAPLARAPVALSAAPGSIRHRAPTLGEHTEAILEEIGYDAGAIADLREASVI
jgi:crotonobetainyl-CoA:carnitine CoA-transferase CaiB-like acyl-CoA transferase